MFSRAAGAITGAGPGRASKDEGASLSSVLETPTLRVELALLILLCIDSMRSDLLSTFDSNKTHDPNSSNLPQSSVASKKPSNNLMNFDEPQRNTRATGNVSTEGRQQELDSMQMQALRRSALTFFDKWRGQVMARICDVLTVRGETVRQAKVHRKQMLEASEKQSQGISSLLDFDEDPFATPTSRERDQQHSHYKPIGTKLVAFEEPKRVLILHCLLLLLLSLEHYPAHSRFLLLRLASSFELETEVLAEHEKSVAQGLLATAASQMDADATAAKQASNDAASRKWKVGLAAVGGAVLIGVTGGLAAPLLAAGLGTVMGGLGLGVVSTYLGALAGSSVLVGSLFGAYGAKMTGRLMEQYAKEVQDFEFIPVQDPERPSLQRNHDWADEQDARDPAKREQHRLRVAIGISGWLGSSSDVYKPWEVIDAESTEPFALRFELDAMLRLGTSLQDVLFNYAWDGLTYTVMSRTMLGALYAGLWPLGLMKLVSVLDNPFSVALARADKAGKVLAHALIDGVQGKRPVTLIGYSVGARVIYACLLELAEQHAFGLVESVVLMGTPAPSDSNQWKQIRSVVAARVVNVYSTEDYVLGYLYRSTKLEFGVAGLDKVTNVHGLENVNMSKLVSGHDRYRYLAGKILVNIGFGDVNFDRVAEQERSLELAERKKERAKEQSKKTEAEPASINANTRESTQSTLPSLIDISDDSTPQQARPTAPPSRPWPATYTQSRSKQQPMQQKSLASESSTSDLRRSPATPSTSISDPLGPTSLIDTAEPTIRKAKFPTASALPHRQLPSSQIAEPASQHQPLRIPAPVVKNSKTKTTGTIAMIDTTQTVVPPKASGDNLKTQPAVTVAEVVVAGHKGAAVAESDMDFCEDDSDGNSSEMGELMMVEPVPMDDFDYGLM